MDAAPSRIAAGAAETRRASLRQSMAWLHGWIGLLFGWLCYFIFLTGTFGYVRAELDAWMRPEIASPAVQPDPARLVALAETGLRREAGNAESWFVWLPGGRAYEFAIGWRTRDTHGEDGRFMRERLDPATGEPDPVRVRDTDGGFGLYVMHYALRYIPQAVAIRITGACAMAMLVAMLSGVIAHRRLFVDFFTFRPAKGGRSWLDAHNLLGVTALPFHLMITWSGLILYLFVYMPAPLALLYPDGPARESFEAQAYGREPPRAPQGRAGPVTPLEPLLAQAQARWGAGNVGLIRVDHAGTAASEIIVQAQKPLGIDEVAPELRFDGRSGRPIGRDPEPTAPARFGAAMIGLHKGRFAGPALRALYVFAGLVGTAMIAAGLLLWTAKRRERQAREGRPYPGLAAAEALNLGTIVGLPIGIAGYFWANRLLPVGMDHRAPWEAHAMFIVWGTAFLFALWRRRDRAWPELCWAASAAYALLPVVNALTTARGLVPSFLARDWLFVGFDLSALAAGLFFAVLAWQAGGRRAAGSPRGKRSATGPA